MKINLKFNPLLFQASLAAGGVALMAFNFLQFSIPHEKGLVVISDIMWNSFSLFEFTKNMILVGIMLLFVIIHFVLTFIFLAKLIKWIINGKEMNDLIGDPYKNVWLFVPISSLAMSANVFWGSLGFFISDISSKLQSYMLPSMVLFGLLLVSLLILEMKALKIWLSKEIDRSKFNFVWLLDVFSFALVSLTGSGIAAMSINSRIASMAAFLSLVTISIGIILFVIKIIYLVYLQIKAGKLPEDSIIPSFFLVIPIMCLFGLSLYRIFSFCGVFLNIELKGLSFIVLIFSYIVTIAWGVFVVYLIIDYFKNKFIKSDFAPTQWGMV
ncbi:MAG: hypothetical protein FD141_666 [Fusobacteria bacterium]|nr:MAG: hypothetical protein FD141_666 [Fusobacteriota bacterium]KAF0228668.1 MAG: hypothetical protein FD182_924 [Fusobacteriota bacterium]